MVAASSRREQPLDGPPVTRLAAFALAAVLIPAGADAACRAETAGEARYAVCEFNPQTDDLRLFLNGESGRPYGEFDLVNAALEAKGETLVFAMNAGMYHKDRTPVGLYVENGEETQKLSTKDGPGNFHLLPNGVFWIGDDGAAGVTETKAFARLSPSPACGRGSREARGEGLSPRKAANGSDDPLPPTPLPQAGEGCRIAHATQSGPMLIIDGALHPKFLIDATSRKRRNGVGVREDGTVVFAISDSGVTFHEFATYFRDALDCPNALYLDGTISRLFSTDLGRNDPGLAMGPIVGVVMPMKGTTP
jgi:uncharacterized protein YigE (DUF2233 family)